MSFNFNYNNNHSLLQQKKVYSKYKLKYLIENSSYKELNGML